jgi:hypothetical protein
MSGAIALFTELPKGDGAHVKLAFGEGKRRGLFADGDPVMCIHTTRNSEGRKQFMVRILYVTSNDPNLQTKNSGSISRAQSMDVSMVSDQPTKKPRKA